MMTREHNDIQFKDMKILNLYACLGGNRFLWGDEHEITAVELDPELARMYQERFPNDNVIIGDAHEYLLKHFREYDFIWSSPPCPTHSRMRMSQKRRFKPQYPDMSLYQQIIILDNMFDGLYCVENVIPYYDLLIPGKKRGRHIFWTNFKIPNVLSSRQNRKGLIENGLIPELEEFHQIDLSSYKGKQRKNKIGRNLVDYEAGKTILDAALGKYESKKDNQLYMF